MSQVTPTAASSSRVGCGGGAGRADDLATSLAEHFDMAIEVEVRPGVRVNAADRRATGLGELACAQRVQIVGGGEHGGQQARCGGQDLLAEEAGGDDLGAAERVVAR
jgi:hypothetical protein